MLRAKDMHASLRPGLAATPVAPVDRPLALHLRQCSPTPPAKKRCTPKVNAPLGSVSGPFRVLMLPPPNPFTRSRASQPLRTGFRLPLRFQTRFRGCACARGFLFSGLDCAPGFAVLAVLLLTLRLLPDWNYWNYLKIDSSKNIIILS